MHDNCEHDPVLEKINAPVQQPLTETQFRMLRGKYFTIQHQRVKECGHLLDQINEPTFRNCEYCWWSFFSSHGELVQVTDKAFQEQGTAFIDKMRGVTYRKNFTRFMATLARLKKENDEQTREIQGSGGIGQSDGQREWGVNDLSTTGEQSESTNLLNSNESNIT